MPAPNRPAGRRMRRLRAGPEPQRSDPRQFPARGHRQPDRDHRDRSPSGARRRTRRSRRPRHAGPIGRCQTGPDRDLFAGSLGSADFVGELWGQQHRIERADAQCRRRCTPEPDDAAGDRIDRVDPIARPRCLPPGLATLSNSTALGRSARCRDPRNCRPGTAATSARAAALSSALGGAASSAPGTYTSSALGTATPSASSVPGAAISVPVAVRQVTPRRADAADKSRCGQCARLASRHFHKPARRAPQSGGPYARNCR